MDCFSKEKRSRIMASIKSEHTRPEIKVRSWLHKMGYRFRLHTKKMPGCPDILMSKYKLAIFVHGCFWHCHPGCKKARCPKTNTAYWQEKLARNSMRDAEVNKALSALGWTVIVIWECEVADGRYIQQLTEVLSYTAAIPRQKSVSPT